MGIGTSLRPVGIGSQYAMFEGMLNEYCTEFRMSIMIHKETYTYVQQTKH